MRSESWAIDRGSYGGPRTRSAPPPGSARRRRLVAPPSGGHAGADRPGGVAGVPSGPAPSPGGPDLAHGESGTQRPLRVVLVRGRHAEGRHDRVTCEPASAVEPTGSAKSAVASLRSSAACPP